MKLWFYDVEVFPHDWLIVFRTEGKRIVVINDKDHLERVLIEIGSDLLVGFNNYGYDDTILGAIMTGRDPYKISQEIIEESNKKLKWQLRITSPLTIDARQELPINLSLKEIEANTGQDIIESNIPWDIDRKLTWHELYETIYYCDYDVQQVEKLMNQAERISYFGAKVGLIKEFNLPISYIRLTRARLMSSAMVCDKSIALPQDRLDFDYAPTLDVDDIDPEVYNFYEAIRQRYLGGGDPEELEKLAFTTFLAGVEHKYGFGGLHGAKLRYIDQGLFVHADFESYYPSEMIKYNFISRRSKKPEILERTFVKRVRLKKLKDPEQEPLKVGINAVFGILKDKFNDAFDPKMSNNICINGQLIISELIKELEPFGELVQTNTDGVIFKIHDKGMVQDIKDACTDFGQRYQINLDNDYINKIAQRDVNNYVMRFDNGKIDAKGVFARWNEDKLPTNFKSNTLSIVDIALKAYYIDGIEVEDTILDLYDRNVMLPFQIISKMGHTYDHMVHLVDGEFVRLGQNVNRVFATHEEGKGIVAKVKNRPVTDPETGEILHYVPSYNKIPNCPDRTVIHNEDISSFDKKKLDLQWYVDLVNDAKFGYNK